METTPMHDGPGSRRSRLVDDGAYQVDLIVAFFSVLLVLLIVSIPRIASEVRNPSRNDYRTGEPTTAPVQLKSFAAVYPYRDIWVMKDGELALIDLEAVARRYWQAGSLQYDRRDSDLDVQITAHSTVLDGYNLKIDFLRKGIPGWLARRRVKLDAVDEAAAALLASPRGSYVFVWADQRKRAARVADALRPSGKPMQLHYLRANNDQIPLSRNPSHFELNSILRAY